MAYVISFVADILLTELVFFLLKPLGILESSYLLIPGY